MFDKSTLQFNAGISGLKIAQKKSFDGDKLLADIELIEKLIEEWHLMAAGVESEARREINRTGLSPIEVIKPTLSDEENEKHAVKSDSLLKQIQNWFSLINMNRGVTLVLDLKYCYERLINVMHLRVIEEYAPYESHYSNYRLNLST